jgi:hypothetical protein
MEEDADNAAVDEGRFGKVDDHVRAGDDDRVKLGLEGGSGTRAGRSSALLVCLSRPSCGQ